MARQRNKHSHWFASRRDFFVTRLFRDFYRTSTLFGALYRDYLRTSRIAFDEIAGLVGTDSDKRRLWRLKDDCHQLWRDADPELEINGCLLDWVIGSIFHEAMKLKENIYLNQFYGAPAKNISDRNRQLHPVNGLECHRFMSRIDGEIGHQMENLGILFGRASYLLRVILAEQTGNQLLLRFLVEQEDMVKELWSESLLEIFTDIFPDAPENGFCSAGRSYFDGNWYEQALKAYDRALGVNGRCDEAVRRRCQLKALIAARRSTRLGREALEKSVQQAAPSMT